MKTQVNTVLCGLLLLLPEIGNSWISGDESVRGPARAEMTHRATEIDNEHGLIWRQTLDFAGLPDALTSEFDLNYWVDSEGYPAALTDTTTSTLRSYILEGMSALPDHSYSLWDWAAGNLTCPIGTPAGSAEVCHESVGHMGPVGANHFLPQAQTTYAFYHELALARATQCAELADQISTAAGDIDPDLDSGAFVQECEREALLLEAFGQHFLQDAWSVGHMWQRWGSPDLSSYGDDGQTLAESVALGAALIHGVEPVLGVQDDLSSGVSDALISLNGETEVASGDLHVSEFASGAETAPQRNQLYQCAAAGVRAVYEETRMLSGDLDEYSGPGTPVDSAQLLGADCFGQRVTNASMLDAIGLSEESAEREALLVGATTLIEANGNELDELTDLFRIELLRLSSVAWLNEILGGNTNPEATSLADGSETFAGFMGVGPNAAFDEVAPFVDPDVHPDDWPIPAGESAGARQNEFDTRPSRILARVFNRAHFAGWCDDAEANPEVLRDRFLNNPSATTLAICESFAIRHVRPVGGQSLCESVGRGTYSLGAEVGQSAALAAQLFCDPPPPPLEILAEVDIQGPRAARVEADFEGPGGRTRMNGPTLPVNISVDETEEELRLFAEILSDNTIVNDGNSATISGSVAAQLLLEREGFFFETQGAAAGEIEWSVAITLSEQPADYRLTVDLSGSNTGFSFATECTGAIGVQLIGPGSNVLQEFYAAGCGSNYPAAVSDVIEGTLQPGEYLLTVTSDTPLERDWSLEDTIFSPAVSIGSTFELRIVEEGEPF